MLRHRLVPGDVFSRGVRHDRCLSRLRHKDPRAKFRAIHVRRLCAGHRWHQQREGRGCKECEAFHDDPAFLSGYCTVSRAHARREPVSRRVLHAQDERRCWRSQNGALMEGAEAVRRRGRQHRCRSGCRQMLHGVESGSRVLANEPVVGDDGSASGPLGNEGGRPVPHGFVMTVLTRRL